MRRRLALLIGCVAVLLAALGLLLMTAGAAEEPSDEDLTAITSLIEQAQALKHTAWPETELASKTLSVSTKASMQESQRTVLQAIGIAEFAEESYFNWPGFHEEARAGDGEFIVAAEFKILGVEAVGSDKSGNLIVHAKVWSGETKASWSDTKSELTSVSRTDATPVWEYVVCKQDDLWKLMSERLIEFSDDIDQDQYGPATPHEQVPAS